MPLCDVAKFWTYRNARQRYQDVARRQPSGAWDLPRPRGLPSGKRAAIPPRQIMNR
jgi:hypothetical protein